MLANQNLAPQKRTRKLRGSHATTLSRPRALAIHAVLVAGSLLFLFPLVWMISTALKPIDQTMIMPPRWIPDPIQWENFWEAVNYIPFFTYARNTLTIAILGTLGTVLSSSIVAYGFARIEWKGRDFVM